MNDGIANKLKVKFGLILKSVLGMNSPVTNIIKVEIIVFVNTNRNSLLKDNKLILSLDECSVFNDETEEYEIGVRLFKEI